MPPRRYGKGPAPTMLAATRVSDECSQASQDNGAESQERESSVADAHASLDPFSYDSGAGERDIGTWDFSDSTNSKKVLSPPAKRMAVRDERHGQAQGGPNSPRFEAGGSVSMSSNFIGEFGQSRAKLDDIEFVLDGLQPSQPEDVRTNSAVALAALCKDQETRVLLRAHALVPKVLSALHAAMKQESRIALAASAVIYLLCVDNANAELISLPVCQTMVGIMSNKAPVQEAVSSIVARPLSKFKKMRSDSGSSAGGNVYGQYISTVRKVSSVLEDSALHLSQVVANHTKGEDGLGEILTAEHLIVCAASTLSMHHAPFRDSFRKAGGVTACAAVLADSLLSLSLLRHNPSSDSESRAIMLSMWKVIRDLTVLESLTFMNKENQTQVLEKQESLIAGLLEGVVRLTKSIADQKQSATKDSALLTMMGECRLAAMKLLVNLTNHNAAGAEHVCKARGVGKVLSLVHFCSDKEGNEDYDVVTLGLGLLINSIEISQTNRVALGQWQCEGEGETAHSFLLRLFLSKITLDKGLVVFDKVEVDKLVVAAYASVLIGCSIKDSFSNKRLLEEALGDTSIVPLVQVLDYFIVCHEEADQGRTVTEEFIDSLTEVLILLKSLLEERALASKTSAHTRRKA